MNRAEHPLGPAPDDTGSTIGSTTGSTIGSTTGWTTGWTTDLDALRGRLAERLRRQGATHPDVAAAALAARGLVGLTVDEWSMRTGVPSWRIEALERGDLP